jgi:PAS domain S-box-containing protein
MMSNLKDLWHRLTAPPATDENEARREDMADVIAERELLLATEHAQARRQAALFRLSADLAAALEETEVCRRVVDGLHDTLGYDHLVLWLVDETTGDRVLVASVGFVEPPTRIPPGQGLSERPLLDGQLHYTPDVTQDPRYIPGLGGSEVDVPVRIGGKVLGVLVAENRQPHAFRQDDFEVLTAAAQQAGLAIEKARLLAAERQRADELDALRTTMADITAELELSALLQIIVERAAGLLDATGGELGLYDEASQEIRIVVSHNLDKDYVGTRHALGEGAMGRVAETGEPLIIEDYQTWEGRAPQYADVQIRASLAAPLMVGGRLVGAITIATADPARQFGPADLHLLSLFAQQAAIAIENARLYDQAQREIAERVRAEAELRKYQEHLEKRVEERTADLRESEERYRTLFDGVPVGLYRTTPAGQFMDANPAMVQMLGYPDRETLLTTNAADLYLNSQDRVQWQALMEREGVVRDFEIRNRRYDGTVIWVNNTARAVRDEGGQVLYYEGSLEDITERKQAEEELRRYQEHLEERVEERTAELRESEERYCTLFDGVPVGLYRTTPTGQILDANLAFVQMLGYPSRENLLAINSASLYADPEERVQWKALMEREGVVRDFEIRKRRYDGKVIWVNDTARAVRDEQGQVLYYEGSLEDITERKRFEEEIRRQKDYFEALFVNSPVAVVTADLDGNVVSWNPMAEKLFAYTQEEAIGKELDDLVANDESIRAEAVGYTDQVINLGRVQVTTKRTRKDGSLVDVELLALPLIVAEEKVGFIAIYHDISERKKIEGELRHQKEYYEALFVNSPVAVVTIDLDGNVVSWNPTAEKLFGYTRAEAIGRNVDELVANDDSIRAEAVGYTDSFRREAYTGVVEAYPDLIDDLGRLQVTTKRTRKDSSLVDVELLGLPVIVAGEKVGFIAIYHDITERKRFEEEIRRQKDYFEALFVNSPVAVLTVDLDANVVSWNPAAEKLFGYTQEEAVGRHLDDLVANDPRVREEALNYTNRLFAMDRVQATAKRTRKDGSLVDVEVLALPVIVAGEKVGFIGIYVDITDLQEARRQAEAANQAKSAFLANMSHELRTPLNAILGFTQLMDRDPNLTAAQQENLGVINRSGEHLLSLINDVLEMSKIEAGRMTLEETSFDLYRLLDGLEEMFGLRARDKGLALSFERAENMLQYVRTDEGKLRQVLSNLLGNAVKFTQQGGVALRVRYDPLPGPPPAKGRESDSPLLPDRERGWGRGSSPHLLFEVEDTGPGMVPEELATVFDPFVQATSGQQAQEGTGLGLSISQQYVRLMGGDIVVSSELGQGSLFQFDVQVGLADAAEVQAAQPRRRVLGLEPNQPIYRLLVTEDKETNRRLLVKLLEPLGFEVKEAVNGQEALEVWERWEPHLIWMDMRMPVMDGYEATRQIKATTKGQATVIIALTATAFEEDRERVLSEGCDDFMRKPFRQDEIFDMLAKYLGVRFIYEEQVPPAAVQPAEAAAPLADVLTPAALAALPAGWVADLQQATIRADLNLILTLTDQIRGQNPALADALADLARNFEYKKILTVIEQAGG